MCYKCFRFYFYIFLVTLPVGYGGTPIYDLYITFRGWVSRLDSPRVKLCNFLRGHFRTFRCSILDGKAIHFIQVCVKMYLFKKTNLLTKQTTKNITNKTTTKTDCREKLSLCQRAGPSIWYGEFPLDYIYIWPNVSDISNIKKIPDSFKPLWSD